MLSSLPPTTNVCILHHARSSYSSHLLRLSHKLNDMYHLFKLCNQYLVFNNCKSYIASCVQTCLNIFFQWVIIMFICLVSSSLRNGVAQRLMCNGAQVLLAIDCYHQIENPIVLWMQPDSVTISTLFHFPINFDQDWSFVNLGSWLILLWWYADRKN